MNVNEAKQLIRPAITQSNMAQLWADLGCGSGTFTIALSSCLEPGSEILAIDVASQSIDSSSNTIIRFIKADFQSDSLPLFNLDGILMANSLHFIQHKIKLLDKLKGCMNEKGIFVLVEYDTAKSNQWVPYPIMFSQLNELFSPLGFTDIRKTGEKVSVLNSAKLYSARIGR